MKISYESLAILRDNLPRGSVTTIRERLKGKNFTYSHQYIYRCLDPESTAYNSIIINEAILFCEEIKRETESQEERVLNLNNPGV